MERVLYKYSFIVPVYNVQKYLKQCVDSLLAQGDKCEILLIDDGSNDLSGKICDEYAEKCKRVKVFHNENKGPSYARNFGLKKATGEYVAFIDSDDYIDNSLIENLEKENLSADLIFYDTIKFFADGRCEPMGDGITKAGVCGKSMDEVREFISHCPKFPASPWAKIIKRDALINNNILFKESVTGEDIDWTLQLMCRLASADFCNGGKYHYRILSGTRRAHGNTKSLDDMLTIIEDWAGEYQDNRNSVLSFLAYQYAVLLPHYGAVSKADRKKFKKRMLEMKFLLSKGKTKKIHLIKIAVMFLGIENASKLLYKYVTKRDKVDA